MIAADQNSRKFGVVDLVAEPATLGCAGCYLDRYGSCWEAGHSPLCQPQARNDRRSIIWVARGFAANPATVAADILRTQGEEVDAASVKRAEAACEEPVAPADVIRCAPRYASLANVLNRAFDQAARGKGAERHGSGKAFERQPMQDLIRLHGVGFATGQASKKAQEALRLPRDRAVAELLGAINYLAGAVIAIEAGDTHHKD